MRPTGSSAARARLILAVPFLTLVAQAPAARAQQAPSDLCAWLTPAQLQKTLGQQFGAPSRSAAPPAYGKKPWGTSCRYSGANGGSLEVLFIAYVESSPTVAKATFEKLSMFYSPNTKVDGIGDEAYIDRQGAIHVLKGKVRYFISIDTDSPARQKEVRDLATQVAAEL